MEEWEKVDVEEVRGSGVPGEWADVCGFIVPPNSHDLWKVLLHGAFTIQRVILGLSQRDQSCHHEAWLHLDLPGDRYAHGSRRNRDHHVHLKERSCPYPPTKEKKVGMMTEVTIHSHLFRRHENLCFHKQAQLTILTLTCGFHQRASRPSAVDLMSCLSSRVQLRTSFMSSHIVTCPYNISSI